MRGDVPGGGYLPPFHADGIEGPDIVHVAGVLMMCGLPAYPPKKTT